MRQILIMIIDTFIETLSQQHEMMIPCQENKSGRKLHPSSLPTCRSCQLLAHAE